MNNCGPGHGDSLSLRALLLAPGPREQSWDHVSLRLRLCWMEGFSLFFLKQFQEAPIPLADSPLSLLYLQLGGNAVSVTKGCPP